MDNTPALQRTLWTLVIALAASLLLLGGGLQALQTATIASALPFAIALLGPSGALAGRYSLTAPSVSPTQRTYHLLLPPRAGGTGSECYWNIRMIKPCFVFSVTR